MKSKKKKVRKEKCLVCGFVFNDKRAEELARICQLVHIIRNDKHFKDLMEREAIVEPLPPKKK